MGGDEQGIITYGYAFRPIAEPATEAQLAEIRCTIELAMKGIYE